MYPIKDFNVQCFIDAAKELLRSDETKRALDLLDNLPAYYRKNVPQEIYDLKNQVMARIATPSFYANHKGFELTVSDEDCLAYNQTLRMVLLTKDVEELNKAGYIPRIWDHGPGEYFLPLLLERKNLKFSYEPIYVNTPTYEHCRHRFEKYLTPRDASQPDIWVSTEILEHLWQPMDIRFEMQQKCGLPDVVHISTPLMTFDSSCTDWTTKDWLGHLFAFTFDEFRVVIGKIFPEYEPAFYEAQIQHSRLIHPSTKFDCIKTHYQLRPE